jgi:hypothetical protein
VVELAKELVDAARQAMIRTFASRPITSQACGMPRGRNAKAPGSTSNRSSPHVTVIEPSST